MVNSLRSSASEQMKQGLFDYLNFNRHKFDEYGQFNPTTDEQDFLPRILLVADEFDPPKLSPKEPWLNRTQRHWAKYPEANLMRNPKTDEDLVRERYEERLQHAKKRRKYGKDKCDEHHAAALTRCNKMYWGNDLYPEGAFQGCVQRAGELKNHCYKEKRYPEGKMEWSNIDMDIVDETLDPRAIKSDGAGVPLIVPPMIPQYELDAGVRAKRLWEPSMIAPPAVIPHDNSNAWAKARRSWQPHYEGSRPANDNFARRGSPFPSARPKPVIKATPGMGYINTVPGLIGGGKSRLTPRYPGDPTGKMFVY